MISIAWPITVIVVAALFFVGFERHAQRARATSEARVNLLATSVGELRSALDAATQRVSELERTVTAPVTGLKDVVLTMRNVSRFGK